MTLSERLSERVNVAPQSIVERIINEPFNEFATWIERQAVAYAISSRTMPDSKLSAHMRWLALQLERFAASVQSVCATTPAEYDERVAILNAEHESQIRDEGYAAAADAWRAAQPNGHLVPVGTILIDGVEHHAAELVD